MSRLTELISITVESERSIKLVTRPTSVASGGRGIAAPPYWFSKSAAFCVCRGGGGGGGGGYIVPR